MKNGISVFIVLLVALTACTAAPTQTPNPDVQAPPLDSPAPAPTSTATVEVVPAPTLDAVETSLSYAEITYYDIVGTTEAELRAQMTALGPLDPYDNNKPVDAYVAWYIYWNWDGYGTADCDLDTAQVWYELYLTMPNWTPPADAAPELVTKWEEYIRALEEHEVGHLDNVINNYETVLTAIQAAACDTADAAAVAALDPLYEFDAAYDVETNHGATQGAVFP